MKKRISIEALKVTSFITSGMANHRGGTNTDLTKDPGNSECCQSVETNCTPVSGMYGEGACNGTRA